MVGRNDIPRRPLGAGSRDRILIRLDVVVPVLPFFDVRRRKLPMLVWIVEPFVKPLLLFVLGYMKEQLDDDRPVSDEVLLDGIDVVVTMLPKCLADSGARNS